MIRRIGFSGCSFTFGSEIKDPETKRWSKLTCLALKAEEINLANPGYSNDDICRLAFKLSYDKTIDLIVIQITSLIRFSTVCGDDIISIVANAPANIFHKKHRTVNLIGSLVYGDSKVPQVNREIWYDFHRWKIVSLHSHLNAMNIKHIFIFMKETDRPKFIDDVTVPDSFKRLCCPIGIDDLCTNNNYAIGDKGHPLEVAQFMIMKQLVLPKIKEICK
jgi:hypothetical protein